VAFLEKLNFSEAAFQLRTHEETISNRDRIKLAQERQKIAEERYREVTKQLEDEKRRNFAKKV
jgi:hypothetical protein